MKLYGIDEREEVCANCKYFWQHYVYESRCGFSPCNAGHCTYPRLKNRKTNDTCRHFCFAKEPEMNLQEGK